MRQPSSPSSQFSSTQGLHPVLQAALDSLDVELEEELTRYRRQRYRQAKNIPAWQPHARRGATDRSPQLPPMDKTSVRLETLAHPPAEPMPSGMSAVSYSSAPQPSQQSVMFGAENFRDAGFSAKNLSVQSPLISQYPEGVESDRTLDRLRELAIAVEQEDWVDPLDEVEMGLEDLPRSDFSESPEDYLDCTEDLLQSIAEEPLPSSIERESSLLNSLLTPLGIGSMVLLLLSSATLGYVIMHPSSLDLLNSPANTSDKAATGASSSTPFASPLIPDSPNLAAEEFVDLNADNLSTIPGSAAGAQRRGIQGQSPLPNTPQTSPVGATASQPNSSNPSPIAVDNGPAPEAVSPVPAVPESVSAASAPEPEPAAAPQPEPIAEEPASPDVEASTPAAPSALPSIDSPPPAAASPEVAAAPASPSVSAGTYYVVTSYNGDPSLEQARASVPGAYVRNFASGASIQLGAFSSAENAQELVQELAAKGITAEVYQP